MRGSVCKDSNWIYQKLFSYASHVGLTNISNLMFLAGFFVNLLSLICVLIPDRSTKARGSTRLCCVGQRAIQMREVWEHVAVARCKIRKRQSAHESHMGLWWVLWVLVACVNLMSFLNPMNLIWVPIAYESYEFYVSRIYVSLMSLGCVWVFVHRHFHLPLS